MSGLYTGKAVVLTVVWGNSPILLDRPAPNTEVEDLHDHEGGGNVSRENLDGEVLLQTHSAPVLASVEHAASQGIIRQAVVHDQQTGFDEPDGDALHLLDHQHHLGPKFPLGNVVRIEWRRVVRVDKVTARFGDDIHANNQHRIRNLYKRKSQSS